MSVEAIGSRFPAPPVPAGPRGVPLLGIAPQVRRDPRVAILVESGDRYAELKGVQISGRLELSEDIDTICDIAAALLVKYEGLDPAYVDATREAYRPTAVKQVAMRLVPERTVSWDHAKMIRTP